MCGFVALLNPRWQADECQSGLERMLDTIAHRGPDDSGTHIDVPVALGFRRLSILDLTPAGHQPMHSADGALTIVFNGEIYNYLELRDELEALGHAFRSSGDTDVLLAAYRQWGLRCLERLNGMWAFVIHDRARGLLFGARDRFGIKPLYRLQQGATVLLASEIKAIRASGLASGRIDRTVLAAHLYQGRLDNTTATFHEGIVSVGAGHAFELALDGRWREWPWWSLEASLANAAPAPTDPAAAFSELFEDAMRVHMRSDVPVGVNLSGGLDSTSIICAAARLREQAGVQQDLLAFCFQDKRFDETRYIDDTLCRTGAKLVPLTLSPEQLWDSLPAMLASQDEPVHSMTALIGYHLMALAAGHGVRVILNGQGADEVIGGYGSYFFDYWSALIRTGRWAKARAEIGAFTEGHGGNARKRWERALRMAAAGLAQRLPGMQGLRRSRRLAALRGKSALHPDLLADLPRDEQPPTRNLASALSRSVHAQPLPLYLRVEDRNSMAHSIEVRLPFLDWRLVRLVFSLPDEWKLSGPWNKRVLREAMLGRIPESVRSRVDKMGFPTDAANWFRGPLQERLRELLQDDSFRRESPFDATQVGRLLDAHVAGQGDHSETLFDAAQLHLLRHAGRLPGA